MVATAAGAAPLQQPETCSARENLHEFIRPVALTRRTILPITAIVDLHRLKSWASQENIMHSPQLQFKNLQLNSSRTERPRIAAGLLRVRATGATTNATGGVSGSSPWESLTTHVRRQRTQAAPEGTGNRFKEKNGKVSIRCRSRSEFAASGWVHSDINSLLPPRGAAVGSRPRLTGVRSCGRESKRPRLCQHLRHAVPQLTARPRQDAAANEAEGSAPHQQILSLLSLRVCHHQGGAVVSALDQEGLTT